MMKSIQEQLENFHAGDTEFHQAVLEVYEDIKYFFVAGSA